MSKPQTRTTQLRNGVKTTTTATAKGTSKSSNPTKGASGSSTSSTVQRKTTTTGSTAATANRALDETKLKLKSTATTRRKEIVTTVSKNPIQSDVVKPSQNTVTRKTTTITTGRTATTTKAAHSQVLPTATTRRTVPATTRRSAITEQPIRAKHNRDVANAVKKKPTNAIKPNAVLDTYHSVTVASPPPQRKEIRAEPAHENVPPSKTERNGATESTDDDAVSKNLEEHPKRVRTHSLKEEDIVVLRSDSAKRRIEQQILADGAIAKETNYLKLDTDEVITHSGVVKEPVAFEVAFEEPASSKSRAKSRDPSVIRSKARIAEVTKEPEVDNYSDDFESYESDFETSSSTQNNSVADSESDTSPNSTDDGENSKSITATTSDEDETGSNHEAAVNDTDCEEESELTQFPVTVIQRDKEYERKLDSGNYEMNSRKHPKLAELTTQINEKHFDSMDTSYSVASTDQLDSGISSYAHAHSTPGEVDKYGGIVCTYGGYAHFNTRPILRKRGIELMNKIQFDTLTFSLFELKPISYDVYMQTYGTLNTTQCSTQTNDNRMSSECQTDSYDMRTMWTQHPPQYDLQTVQKFGTGIHGALAIQNCCGESPMEEYKPTPSTDKYDISLQKLEVFRQNNNDRLVSEQLKGLHKPLDFERLNSFLLRSAVLMSKVLNSAQDSRQEARLHKLTPNQHSLQEVSEGYMRLETKLLNALRVVRVFASARHELIITVHTSTPDADVYRADFSHLLMVWSTSDGTKPLRLLSTWSEVCRVEICHDSADIVVCGLHDGSIAMWDLRDTYSFCSKLDGYLTHFAATQSVVPVWSPSADSTQRLSDLGAVVDVRSFRTPQKVLALGTYRSIQFAALNDSGILSSWTLVEACTKQREFATTLPTDTHRTRKRNTVTPSSIRFEYSSPWARVKLIQSAICDLREYLERGLRRTQTQFEMTKQLFQKEIYSDEVLRELHGTKSAQQQRQQLQGLRFTGIDTGCERIYVCTNRNFVLACSKSLKVERFRKININESELLFATALQVLTNEHFLAVGLSNGSVMIVNCNQQKVTQQQRNITSGGRSETASSMSNSTMSKLNTPATPDIDPITGKSCAIQNIILNERRLLSTAVDNNTFPSEYEMRPSTAACIALINNQKRPFELRIYDQQIILSGSALRKDLVQSLALSSDGWRLFALVNGRIRTYDFYLDREIDAHSVEENPYEQRVMDIAVAKSSQTANHLIVLDEENDVEVHLLKQ